MSIPIDEIPRTCYAKITTSTLNNFPVGWHILRTDLQFILIENPVVQYDQSSVFSGVLVDVVQTGQQITFMVQNSNQ